MHEWIFSIAMVWLILLLAVNVVLVATRRPLVARILAVDTSTLIVIAALLLLTAHSGETYYLDAALVVALLSFLETLAAARYVRERVEGRHD